MGSSLQTFSVLVLFLAMLADRSKEKCSATSLLSLYMCVCVCVSLGNNLEEKGMTFSAHFFTLYHRVCPTNEFM